MRQDVATVTFDRFRPETYYFRFMLRRLPEFIEPLRWAGLGRSVKGRLPLARLRRLAESLQSTGGEVLVELEFGIDEQGRPSILGTVSARVEVLCQRCLSAMVLPLDLDVRLYLTASESEVADASEGFDTLMVGDEPMRLADIVEDELILGLPLVAMHSPDVCAVTTQYGVRAGEQVAKPFAVLAELKKGPKG